MEKKLKNDTPFVSPAEAAPKASSCSDSIQFVGGERRTQKVCESWRP